MNICRFDLDDFIRFEPWVFGWLMSWFLLNWTPSFSWFEVRKILLSREKGYFQFLDWDLWVGNTDAFAFGESVVVTPTPFFSRWIWVTPLTIVWRLEVMKSMLVKQFSWPPPRFLQILICEIRVIDVVFYGFDILVVGGCDPNSVFVDIESVYSPCMNRCVMRPPPRYFAGQVVCM